ncbi:universal stress protein [Aquincola sp. S2]|uniref:Universal stress protein n=1 Tax=Pseudaquabacterium terrae TaxID=2732868 RepID=A0ABX2ERL3_9BURK|nr:universal stress protein [Aquabacterium terrae]
MASINSILHVTDLTEAALPALQRAVLLAAENEARLTILTAGPGKSCGARRSLYDAHLAERRVRRMLNRLGRELRAGHEVRWIAVPREVDAIEQILRAADDADLVVLGGGSDCSLRSLLFGTTTERLVRLSRRPVLVVKRPPSLPSAPYRRALLPVDLADATFPAVGWAARVAPQASLHLLHALSVPMASRLRMADCSDELVRSTVQRAKTVSQHRLWHLAATLPARRTHTTVAEGLPAVLTLQKSREAAADLIVVGKSGRSLLGDLLLGSTAQRLLSEADTDLLVVPKTSRSPSGSSSANAEGKSMTAVEGRHELHPCLRGQGTSSLPVPPARQAGRRQSIATDAARSAVAVAAAATRAPHWGMSAACASTMTQPPTNEQMA